MFGDFILCQMREDSCEEREVVVGEKNKIKRA